MKSVSTFVLSSLVILLVTTPGMSQETIRMGVVLGRVYEIDKARYRRYIEEQRRRDVDFDEALAELDAHDFVDERAEVVVTGRQLATNLSYASEHSKKSGDYDIRETPVGTYEFTLQYEGVMYPVQQRLDLNVQLSYVVELCFVIDREEQVAWMVADGPRRTRDVPPWVPRECTSGLSECLAGIIGDDGLLPDGLLLLLAGGGATAITLGIISTEQTEASPPVPPN